MEQQLYRKVSLEHIESPEQLNEVLRVTSPSVWVLLAAVIVLLLGFLVWGSFTYVDSKLEASAVVSGGTMTLRLTEESAQSSLEEGMKVTVGDSVSSIRSIGEDEQGTFALADTDLVDGTYSAVIHYRQTQLLRLLFN